MAPIEQLNSVSYLRYEAAQFTQGNLRTKFGDAFARHRIHHEFSTGIALQESVWTALGYCKIELPVRTLGIGAVVVGAERVTYLVCHNLPLFLRASNNDRPSDK